MIEIPFLQISALCGHWGRSMESVTVTNHPQLTVLWCVGDRNFLDKILHLLHAGKYCTISKHR